MISKGYLKVSGISLMLAVVMLLTIFSCSKSTDDSDDKIVAKAFDKTLSMTDLESLFGANMSKQDSFFIAKEYIDNWLQKQVLLYYAAKEEIGSTLEIDKRVENFREDLISFEYRKKMLSEKLDTNISLKETKAYYVENPENFELKQNIIRLVFIKMPVALENRYKFWNKFSKANDDEISKMAIMALKNGGNAYLDKETWLAFDDILKVVPINTYNQEHFLNNNRIFKIEEEKYTWYVNIIDLRIKDNISPFEFVEENIHQILLNKRKTGLLQKLEHQIVEKAKKDNQIKVYLPQYE